jgi:hypothetical protein
MQKIDRREMLMAVVCGGAATAIGLTAMPRTAGALPLGNLEGGVTRPAGLVEEALVTVNVHKHPRRHRNKRWRCWWHRGRRRCGWRW